MRQSGPLPRTTAKAMSGDRPARSRRTSCSRGSRGRSRRTACRSCRRPRRAGSAGRACCGRSPLAVPMRVVSSIMRPTSAAAAAVGDVARARRRAAPRGGRRASTARSISVGAGISPPLAIVAASSAPCIGDSVECQKPADARANSSWSSAGTSRCDGSTGSSKGIVSPKPKARPIARQIAGGQVRGDQLGDDGVLRLADAVGQRVAAAIDGAGCRSGCRAGSTRRRRGSRCASRPRRRSRPARSRRRP